MDIHDLRRRVLAAREFTVAVDDRVQFVLRLPTEHQRLLVAERAHQKSQPHRAVLRELLVGAVVGWAGLRMEDLLPDTDEPGPLDFDEELAPDLVPMVLDVQAKWADVLEDQFMGRMVARQAPVEEAAKN